MKTKLLLSLLLLTVTSPAFANGEKAGNGGIGYVCRDKNGKIESAELLDLVEARNTIRGYVQLKFEEPTIEQKQDLDIAFKEAADLIRTRVKGKNIQEFIIGVMKKVRSKVVVQDFNVGVPNPKDFDPKIPETDTCHYEVIANYLDGVLRVSSGVYGALTFTSQIAFWIHEGFNYQWKFVRGHQKSNEPRELIGAVFNNSREYYGMLEAQPLGLSYFMNEFNHPTRHPIGFGLQIVCELSSTPRSEKQLVVFEHAHDDFEEKTILVNPNEQDPYGKKFHGFVFYVRKDTTSGDTYVHVIYKNKNANVEIDWVTDIGKDWKNAETSPTFNFAKNYKESTFLNQEVRCYFR